MVSRERLRAEGPAPRAVYAGGYRPSIAVLPVDDHGHALARLLDPDQDISASVAGDASIDIATAAVAAARSLQVLRVPLDRYAHDRRSDALPAPLTLCCRAPLHKGRDHVRRSSDRRANLDLMTIGHSNLPADRFITLLRDSKVSAIVDVRSVPFSRWCPSFSSKPLATQLAAEGLAYLQFGGELGAAARTPTLLRRHRRLRGRRATARILCQARPRH